MRGDLFPMSRHRFSPDSPLEGWREVDSNPRSRRIGSIAQVAWLYDQDAEAIAE
jgi:hypothetical protein